MRLARRFVSSCSAPNGHNQPQKAPRFQNKAEAAVANHKMKISGAIKK